jgi:hypothetical protein
MTHIVADREDFVDFFPLGATEFIAIGAADEVNEIVGCTILSSAYIIEQRTEFFLQTEPTNRNLVEKGKAKVVCADEWR